MAGNAQLRRHHGANRSATCTIPVEYGQHFSWISALDRLGLALILFDGTARERYRMRAVESILAAAPCRR